MSDLKSFNANFSIRGCKFYLSVEEDQGKATKNVRKPRYQQRTSTKNNFSTIDTS